MIVPRTRLLLALACSLPLWYLVALESGSSAIACLAILAAVAAIDAVAARGRLRDIAVALPDRARCIRAREGSIPVTVASPRGHDVTIGLAAPRLLGSPQESLAIPVDRATGSARAAWKVMPAERGRFLVERCHFETPSPLGFFAARGSTAAALEVRVYPNMERERKNLAPLFMNRGAAGIHAMRLVGRGREFDKLREYVPGDAYDEIHWKATARRSRPITKVFRIERTQEVYAVIDASRLAARRIDGERTIERFLTAALALGLAAESQGDKFGVAAFDDRLRSFVRASSGRPHYSACRDAIHALEPRLVSPDFRELATFLRTRLRRRALLVFLTELDDPALAESFWKNVEALTPKHLALVLCVRPPIVRPLFSGAEARATDELYERLGGHVLWQHLAELEKNLARHGVEFAAVDDARLSVEMVSRYVRIKRRQLL